MRIAILIPTYNEAKNISLLLPKIHSVTESLPYFFEVYIIDDSSPDGTREVALSLAQSLKRDQFCIEVISRTKKEGLRKAYIDAFQILLTKDSPPDFVMQMDADLSHDPRYISDFVKAIESDADFIVGSRYIDGGSTPNWSWYRKLLSVGGNFYTRAVLSKAITDYTGGFNGYSIGLLKKMNLASINHEGYGFLISFKYAAIQYSQKIIEVPIQFLDREYGESKMPMSTVFRNFVLVLSMKLKELISK